MKNALKISRDLLVSIWAGLLIIRVVLFLARLVGAIGALETVGVWLGHENAVEEFEKNVDAMFWIAVEWGQTLAGYSLSEEVLR